MKKDSSWTETINYTNHSTWKVHKSLFNLIFAFYNLVQGQGHSKLLLSFSMVTYTYLMLNVWLFASKIGDMDVPMGFWSFYRKDWIYRRSILCMFIFFHITREQCLFGLFERVTLGYTGVYNTAILMVKFCQFVLHLQV